MYTFNIEGASRNYAYTNTTLYKADILCIQEHWLHQFEKHRLQDLLPGWKNFQAKSYDEASLTPNTHRPTGRGGVATLWSQHLDTYARPHEEEGNERILLTTFDLPNFPVCIINCYLPSGVESTALANFCSDLDALHELCQKYGPTHHVLICGDLNADHYHRTGLKEGRLLDLIREHSLLDPGQTAPESTYINTHLGHSSRIDHMLLKPSCSAPDVSLLVLHKNQELNTSSHIPLCMDITTPSIPHSGLPRKKKETATYRVFNYHAADPQVFASTLDEELSSYNLQLMDTEGALHTLQAILDTASLAAIPYRTVNITDKQKKRRRWTPELAAAVRDSKHAKYLWDCAGQPRGNHQLWTNKKKATKRVRTVQRREEAVERAKLREDISSAHQNDQALFFRLVKRQRQNSLHTTALLVDNNLITDQSAIREEFATAFEKLATPETANTHLKPILEQMRLLAKTEEDHLQIQPDTLREVILGLKCNKAADRRGHKAEHLRLLLHSQRAVLTLTNVLNQIFKTCTIPSCAKSAFKTPVHKKGKTPLLTDNYRGITVSSILGKLVEHLIKHTGSKDINYDQSPLQFGFTEDMNPNMASLVITESLAECRETRKDLYVCSLDARKAFDIVPHDLLKFKLYHTPLRRSLWLLVDDLYTENYEAVRWQGTESREYMVQQGVRQGGVLSTDLYKLFSNSRLLALQKSGLGLHIGCNFLGAAAVADDQLLISTSKHELQGMMSICHDYATDHQEILHPTKSVVVELYRRETAGEHGSDMNTLRLGDDPVTVAPDFTHLGLQWAAGKTTPSIDERVKSARRTAYSLMGVGLHGRDGLDPPTSASLVTTYITPRLLYGLSATNIPKNLLRQLSQFHKTLLRQIQGLPQNTACSAVYLMIGSIPIEGLLDLSQLSLLGAISRLDYLSPLRQTAVRQLSLKSDKSRSWFINTAKLGTQYGLDIYNIILHPWPKLTWKKHTRYLVTQFWFNKLKEEASTKTTLKWLLLHDSWISQIHPAWGCCRGKPFQTGAATIRVTLLLGRYGLQQERVSYTKQESNPTCPLCNLEEEDVCHFILRCPHRYPQTDRMIADLQKMYMADGKNPPSNCHELTSAVLNGWGYCSGNHTGPCSQITNIDKIISLTSKSLPANQLCNTVAHHLHIHRDEELNHKLLLLNS